MANFKDAVARQDTDEIISCLYKISRSRGAELTIDDEKLILILAEDDDDDIREAVANCIGLRVGLMELYPIYFRRLQGGEANPNVKCRVISAGMYLAKSLGVDDLKEISKLFASIVLNEAEDDEVRAQAYNNLAYAWHKYSAGEFASSPYTLSEINWDREFVESFLGAMPSGS